MKITIDQLIKKAANYIAGNELNIKGGKFDVNFVEKIDSSYSGTDASGCAVTCVNSVHVYAVSEETITSTTDNYKSSGQWSSEDTTTSVGIDTGMVVHHSWDDIGGFRCFESTVDIACDDDTRKKIEILAHKLAGQKKTDEKQKARDFFHDTKREIIDQYGIDMFEAVLDAGFKVSLLKSAANAVAKVPHLYEHEKAQAKKFTERQKWRFCPDFAPRDWNCAQTSDLLSIAIKLQNDMQVQKTATHKPFEGLSFLKNKLSTAISIAV